MKIINPATGKLIKEIQTDTTQTVAAKYQAAKSAQPAWATKTLNARLEVIRGFRELLKADLETLSATLTSEVGKPLSQSRNELNGTLTRIDYFLEMAPKTLQDETVFDDPGKMKERLTHEPLGVIANISAWNYPYFVGSNVFIPGLLAGNAVLYKPSEFAALSGQAIAERLWKAGVPKDVFALITGEGSIGAELLNQPVNGVYFTGSYATGRKIAEAAGKKMIHLQLELGGKDPVYICEDVDIQSAAEGTADGAFYNAGQSCCSVERIYVHEKIYDSFVEKFLSTVRSFKMGDPTQDGVYLGPLTRAANLKVLEAQVADALKKGAKLLCGGARSTRADLQAGPYFEPTVLIHVDHTMEVMREESFGPIIGIQKVKDDSEAIRLMNDTAYGLTSGVYTRNRERAEAVLRAMNSGSVYWNCCDRVSPRLPWSGRGHSGLGSTLGSAGITAFTQPKAWHLRT